ncbi:MAG TPA: (Fe-S)-binding protein, partial [Cupriavidus sp.]|nr:(Fe-S)-binding protein [Cupriavidus sp.]
MQVHSMEFKARAGQKLADQRLQQNLKKLSTKFVTARADAIRDIDFDATRAALKERRNRALENLDVWLAKFEESATKRGATVLFAESTADAARLVGEIAQKHGVKKVIKSKSMVTEEMRLNQVLGEMGV